MSEFYTNCFARGARMFVRGYRDGSKFKDVINYEPTLFVGKPKGHKSDLKAFITDLPVEEIKFENMREAREFVKKYEDVEGFNIFGNTNYVNQYIGYKWTKEVPFDASKIDVRFIDIETETESGFPNIMTANERILLVTFKRRGRTPVTFTWKPVEGAPLNTEYRLCHDEESMLRSIVTYVKTEMPDVLSGWNIEAFDIPYLCVRIKNILGEDFLKQLSPFGFVEIEEIENMGRQELRVDISGIAILDLMAMYKKFTFTNRESYRLDFIAEVELGKNKLDHSEFASFKDFYTGDWRKFVEYNIIDTTLLEELDDKLDLLNLVYSVAYLAKINFTDVYSPIKTWESMIYNHLLAQKVVIPMKKHSTGNAFEGAYVKDTLVGSYRWVVTLDLTSLYPHIIMLCNMSPETIVGMSKSVDILDLINKIFETDFLKDLNCTMAGNGQLFSRDTHGVFPILMHNLFNERKRAKDEMIALKKVGGDKSKISALNTYQNAVKVLLNSLFGAMGNAYFRYYDLRIAEGITKTGQLAIRWIERKINEKFNDILGTKGVDYVIASDTDSVMVNFGPIIDALYPNHTTEETIQYLDKINKEVVQPYIQKCYVELAEYINAYEASLHMKRENLCDRGVFYKKKRYILNVWDSEGVKFYGKPGLLPELKIMGIELVKSSTPKIVRDELKGSIKHILYGTNHDIRKYHGEIKTNFFDQPVESIASPRSVNDIDKWQNRTSLYISGTPQHVKAAIMFNHMIDKLNLGHKYQRIKNGDKIKLVYLKVPNPTRENIIGFIDSLPPEFDLHRWVDYQKQFETVFESSLESMIEPLGWKVHQRPSFDI